jgi:lipid II:glycine glycyltransferase (peptidoglycan interpeptide bridge formation enzyme)
MNNTQIYNKYTIEICKKKENQPWDDFLEIIPGVNSSQTALWAMANFNIGDCHDFLRIIIKAQNEIIGGAQILIKKYSKIGKIGFIIQGPCFQNDDTELHDIIIKEIKATVKRENLLYLTVDVFHKQPNISAQLLKAGFIQPDKNLPPYQLLESSLIVDLTQNSDELFNQFDIKRRKNIKSGQKFTYQHRLGKREDIPHFLDLIKQTCQRRNTNPLVDSIDYFYSVWDKFAPHNKVMLHLAEVDGETICGTFCFTFGDTFCTDLWGWNGKYAKEKISETYFWNLILWAKENGFKNFDFVHLDKISAHAIRSGEEILEETKKRHLFSATHFKLRWGGAIIDYPGHFTYFRNPLIKHLIINLFTLYILISKKLKPKENH